jgi:transposase
VHRFGGPGKLASWAGLTPKHYESDTAVHCCRITKQGSRLVRWARWRRCNAPRRAPGWRWVRDRVGARRGRNIGTVAPARGLVEMVFYALSDHHIRRLVKPAAAA